MNLRWYTAVAAGEPLNQGDIIKDCPVVSWRDQEVSSQPESRGGHSASDLLERYLERTEVDAVVMTQTCDLAQGKVTSVVLCPWYPVEGYKQEWEIARKAAGQNPTAKSWYAFLDAVKKGQVFNLALLNADEETGALLGLVDFQEVFTLPRVFLESYVALRGARLRLLPPYREHLSQAFARFFMRVGLPADIDLSHYKPQ